MGKLKSAAMIASVSAMAVAVGVLMWTDVAHWGRGGVEVASQSASRGIWITREEIMALPMSGKPWEKVKADAARTWAVPDLSDQDDPTNCYVLAGAYVAVRTSDQALVNKVRAAVAKIPETENGGRTLALGRELGAYVIAIDLVGWDTAAREVAFKSWLKAVIRESLDGKTLVGTMETRPANWGTIAGFSLACVAVYLDDRPLLDHVAVVFQGYLGDRSKYKAFTYGDLWWQAVPAAPVGIDAKGTQIQGHSVDGVLPEEMRRSGVFVWPPPKENYVYTGLEGVIGQALILSRWGYPAVWTWSDSAILRAYTWLHAEASFPAVGNDVVQIPLVNWAYKVTFPIVEVPAGISRAYAYTDWGFGKGDVIVLPPPPPPPPQPDDIQVGYVFHFDGQLGKWTVQATTDDVDVIGTGTTTADALRDWLIRNPNKP